MKFLSRIFGRTRAATEDRHGHDGMVSLVALFSSWRPWSLESVRRQLDALFPGEFLPAREVGNFVLDGPVPDATYLVQSTVSGYAGMFFIHNVPGPYREFSDFLSYIQDSRLRRTASRQPCWISVDMIHRHTSDEEAFRFVSVVMAKLAPPDASVLVHPGRNLAAPFTQQLRATLASGGAPFGATSGSADAG